MHKYRKMVITLDKDGEEGDEEVRDFTLSINGVPFNRLPKAPARER